jgi:hypothetical protein
MPSHAHRPFVRALALVSASVALAGCDVKTSDRDLVFLSPPEATERLHTRPGMFEKAINGCWVDPRGEADYQKVASR